ncbi:transmembrane amino acid transporter protein-domain-containing protein [Mrakia frigida]|uniref:transmembrane amino acid transporter protein-domain-containing protein n=1 Tax=Mrakia frigida TaxID=29902 RepID=UPI003FCC1035
MADSSAEASRTVTPTSLEAEKNLANLDAEKNGASGTPSTSRPEKTKYTVKSIAVDDVFSDSVEGSPDYRGVSWPAALVLMMKSQIGLGVLSLPNTMNTLGYVPGILLVIFLGIITTYGDYEIGRFRNRYAGVHSVGDVGFVMGGVIGREVLGWCYWLYQCFNAASGMLATSIALNAVTGHATCTVAFTVTAAVIVGVLGSARTFKQISWMGWVGICCILPAIFIVTIACGISDRPPQAPAGPFDKELKAFNNPNFGDAMVAVVNILFAYGGSPGYFSIIAEMKNPLDYNKAMFCAQGFAIILYVTISTVLWFYCGQYIASPALGSAGPLIKKIAYGIAIPGLLASPIIYSHLAIKFCFVRLLRGSHHLQHSTPTHWITWISLCVGVVSFSFIIAEVRLFSLLLSSTPCDALLTFVPFFSRSKVIPFFDDLIGLIGAVFASFFCITLFGFMWLFDDNEKKKSGERVGARRWTNKFLHANAYMMIVVGSFIFVAGFYGCVLSIQDSFNEGTVGSPFSCADNSG